MDAGAGRPGAVVIPGAEAAGGDSYYEAHRKVYPREVAGRFANLRIAAAWVLLGLFYLLPWLQWGGRQAVLFDLPARKFHILGLTLWPQDFIYLTWLLVIAALSLFFFTAIAGRLWCGYACPQTVWTEVFLWMERVTEGGRGQRIKLDEAPWSGDKLRRKAAKQLLWVGFAAWTGLTFVGFFTPVRELAGATLRLGLGPWETFWVLFYGAATYGNAGFLREQVCKYMCPYARFQSAMFDRDTLVITYDAARGEPRGGRKRGVDPRRRGLGDCTDCTLCVQACPTGIDIRNGLQYECIACAACIDACDSVMDRMGYPRGLVRYATHNALEHQPARLLRPRVLAYGALLALLCVGLVASLALRKPVALDAIHDRNTLYRMTEGGEIENVYTLKVVNKADVPRRFDVSVGAADDAASTADLARGAGRGLRLREGSESVVVGAGEVLGAAVAVRRPAWSDDAEDSPADAQHDESPLRIRFRIRAADDPRVEASADARFFAPEHE